MKAHKHFKTQLLGAACAAMLSALSVAHAGVVVSASGNTAVAEIALASGGHHYTATVTITFSGAQNLNPTELNLSAQLVDPLDPGLLARLPACVAPASGCVTIDPNFPMLVTVEPLNLAAGNLSFLNNYEFEFHTPDLTYVPYSEYRTFKAPVTGSFTDVTDGVSSGSVRARGTGGSFSQFLVVSDTRPSLTVETQKDVDLKSRIQASSLNRDLLNTLLGLLSNVESAVAVGNYALAISSLDRLINTVQANAGTNIANVWSSNHLLANDAGDMLSLAQSLRFTLARLQNGH